MGANPSAAVFYSRVKGEVDAAVQTLGYRSVSIVRPSMLAGERGALGQLERPLEKLSLRLTHAVGSLIPANYRAVQAADVACGLIQAVQTGKSGTTVLLSGALQGAQQRYLDRLRP